MRLFLFFIFSILTSFHLYAAVNPIPLGRASNIYSVINPNQNQVYADPIANTVAFIHQQDVTIWGGGSAANGKLRYDVSIDGGMNFSNDIGVCNNVYQRAARYPQVTGYNPLNYGTGDKIALAYWGMNIINNEIPDGHVTGIGRAATESPATFTENYLFMGENTYKPGGMCQGMSGEFWIAEADHDDTKFVNFITLTKGIYDVNSADINWAVGPVFIPNHQHVSAQIMEPGPNMAFSPDGSTGWVVFGGDIQGSTDGVYTPIFYRTTNGGATWTDEIFINFNDFPSITSRLDNAFLGASNQYGMIGSFDITVDKLGNPHLLTVVGHVDNFTGQRGDYKRMLVDLTSNNGGESWEILYIAPILTTVGSFGSGVDLVDMNNYCQIGRSNIGNHIFYNWSDSVIPDGNGSFVFNDLLAPNLRSSSYRITDGYRTCISKITDFDFIWDGRALFPTVAPIVLGNAVNGFKVPTVIVEMLNNDPVSPCQFHYFGNEVEYFDNGYVTFENYDPDNYLEENNSCELGTALPLQWVDFQVFAKNDHIELSWEVADQSNISTFLIQRKYRNDFETIGQISSKMNQSHYQSIDQNVTPEKDFFYRIKYIESNGQQRVSPIRSARIKKESNFSISLSPNPVVDLLQIKIPISIKNTVEMKLLNSNGQLLLSEKLNQPLSTILIGHLNLPKGIYFIKIETDNWNRVERVILQ